MKYIGYMISVLAELPYGGSSVHLSELRRRTGLGIVELTETVSRLAKAELIGYHEPCGYCTGWFSLSDLSLYGLITGTDMYKEAENDTGSIPSLWSEISVESIVMLLREITPVSDAWGTKEYERSLAERYPEADSGTIDSLIAVTRRIVENERRKSRSCDNIKTASR